MYDLCCIGHITSDRIVTADSTSHIPGGTAWYFSHAIRPMPVRYRLITALGAPEINYADALLQSGVDVAVFPSQHTVCFENIYGVNQDHRVQKVTQQADPFSIVSADGTSASIFHLGPLLAGDIPSGMIESLSRRAKLSLDVQGLLREVRGEDVHAIDWREKREMLPFIHYLKANESEASVLTGTMDHEAAARMLYEWGAREVIITLGSHGSLIYDGDRFTRVPAYAPSAVKDATGSGDTYMAGYLYRRLAGDTIAAAGSFAAAMATIAIQAFGPFTGTEDDVMRVIEKNEMTS